MKRGTPGTGPGWASLCHPHPHLPFTNKEQVPVEISGSLAVIMQFMIQKGERKASTRAQIMYLRRVDFDLFRKRGDGMAWESEESWKACRSWSTESCKQKIIQFSSSGGKTHLPGLAYLIRNFTEIAEAEKISMYWGLQQKQAPRWAVHGIDVACMDNVKKAEAQSGTCKGQQGSQESILLLH